MDIKFVIICSKLSAVFAFRTYLFWPCNSHYRASKSHSGAADLHSFEVRQGGFQDPIAWAEKNKFQSSRNNEGKSYMWPAAIWFSNHLVERL